MFQVKIPELGNKRYLLTEGSVYKCFTSFVRFGPLVCVFVHDNICFLVVQYIYFQFDCFFFSVSFVIPLENLKPTENQQGKKTKRGICVNIIAHNTTCPVLVICLYSCTFNSTYTLENGGLMFSMLPGPSVEQKVQT